MVEMQDHQEPDMELIPKNQIPRWLQQKLDKEAKLAAKQLEEASESQTNEQSQMKQLDINAIEQVNEEVLNESNTEDKKDNFASARSSKVSGASYSKTQPK